MSVISPDEAKDHLKLTGFSLDDGVLDGYIAAAQGAIENRCGPLTPVPVVEQVTTGPAVIMLSTLPVLSVQTVTLDLSAVSTSSLRIDSRAGLLTWTSGGPRAGAAGTVNYTAGRDEVPSELRTAVLEMLRYLLRQYRAARPGQQSAAQPPSPTTVPAVVQMLMTNHTVAGIA